MPSNPQRYIRTPDGKRIRTRLTLSKKPPRQKPGETEWNDKVRNRIRGSSIVDLFMAHMRGEKELSQTQVAVGKVLLAKILPDLSQIEGSVARPEVTGDPKEIARQVGLAIAANPQMLLDVLRQDEQALTAVQSVVETLLKEKSGTETPQASITH